MTRRRMAMPSFLAMLLLLSSAGPAASTPHLAPRRDDVGGPMKILENSPTGYAPWSKTTRVSDTETVNTAPSQTLPSPGAALHLPSFIVRGHSKASRAGGSYSDFDH